jgi:BioD-like phosphotransacetylase family protein
MSLLFIGSTGDRAGHSLITWAMARKFAKLGLRVGFLKPFGTAPIYVEGRWIDHDAYLISKSLKLEEPLEVICPFLVSDEEWRTKQRDEIMMEFKSLVQELSESKDILIVMGSKHIFFDDAACPIPDISFISELKSDCILIHRFRKIARTVYSILSVSSLVKDKMKGIILNRVPPENIAQVRSLLIPTLRDKGIPVSAALPEDAVLSFLSVREVGEILKGDVLWGKDRLENPVGGMTVGSADLTGGLLLFKRAYNKIILMEPSSEQDEEEAQRTLAGILLTGGRKPPSQLVRAAEKAGVPLLLIEEDTFAALERLEQSTSRLAPEDEGKVRHMTELMERNGDFNRLLRSLGL